MSTRPARYWPAPSPCSAAGTKHGHRLRPRSLPPPGPQSGYQQLPPKHCSYSCLYCQVGTTGAQEISPRAFYPPEEILDQVTRRLETVRARGEAVDYLTFVPDGEPTLDIHLGAAIDGLRGLGLPIAVISNASLIWREDARAALARSDWVSLKIDSVDPTTWRQINQPHTDLALADILAGIRTFATGFKGSLVSVTMLLAGINDSAAARRVTRLRTGSRRSTRLEKIWPGAEGGGSRYA